MSDKDPRIPSQDELERELSEYLSRKYGVRIKVVTPVLAAAPDPREPEKPEQKPPGADAIRFDMKPDELVAYLDQYVVKQEEAKAVLATKISTHYNRVKLERRRGRAGKPVGRIKNNIMLLGPTGVGKTYLVKLIAQKIGVPFVKGDATKFSETGYIGGDVEDLVRDLVTEAEDDIELAQYGIIYIDEIDKIAATQNIIGPDVSRKGVQRALLKPMEETDVDLKVAHDPISQMQAIEQYRKTGKREKRSVNTANILFILSGAFNDLAAIVAKRLQSQEIGFGAALRSREDDHLSLRHVKAEDLIAYGFESEFVGRIPVIAVLDPLSVEDLYAILKNPHGPVIQAKRDDFRCYGIDIRFENAALRLIAERAALEKTGARGLLSVIEKVLMAFERRLPSTSVKHLVVAEALVRNPEAELSRILSGEGEPERLAAYADIIAEERERLRAEISGRKRPVVEANPLVFSPRRIDIAADHYAATGLPLDFVLDEMVALYNQVRAFEKEYAEKHSFRVHYNEDALNEILVRALDRGVAATTVCDESSRDYDYAFKLIADRSGRTQFILPAEAVTRPEQYLNDLIRETYRQYPLSPGAPPEFIGRDRAP